MRVSSHLLCAATDDERSWVGSNLPSYIIIMSLASVGYMVQVLKGERIVTLHFRNFASKTNVISSPTIFSSFKSFMNSNKWYTVS